jgi:hypothetical protein
MRDWQPIDWRKAQLGVIDLKNLAQMLRDEFPDCDRKQLIDALMFEAMKREPKTRTRIFFDRGSCFTYLLHAVLALTRAVQDFATSPVNHFRRERREVDNLVLGLPYRLRVMGHKPAI